MNIYRLLFFVSACISAAAYGASSSSRRPVRKAALANRFVSAPTYNRDREYLARTVEKLNKKGASSEAFQLCHKAIKVLPEKHHAPFRLFMGRYCMKDNELGWQANLQWAQWNFEMILKLPKEGNAVEREQARNLLKEIEGMQSTTLSDSVPQSASESQSGNRKRGQRAYSIKEAELKRAETAPAVSCPVCEQTFGTSRAMRVHQSRKGHTQVSDQEEEFDFIEMTGTEFDAFVQDN